MKTVNVLRRIDRLENFSVVYVFRQRQLDQNAVNIVPAVEFPDDGEKLGLRYVRGEVNMLGIHSKLFGRFNFAADVNRRCRVLTDADHCQARAKMQCRDLCGYLGLYGFSYGFPFEDACGHNVFMIAEACGNVSLW